MKSNEVHKFRLSDAIKFHDELNPRLWSGVTLRPAVRSALLKIAEDFRQYLGISELTVLDITISGSNAAYTYTLHSDIDLHLLIDGDQLDPDDVYQELFRAKKTLYNDSHAVTIRGIAVECYVQDSRTPAVTSGEYSIKNNRWLRMPSKRRIDVDEGSVALKYEKLSQLAELALKSNKSGFIRRVLEKIRKYRQSGLTRGGEFSVENLAFKALRSSGVIDQLYKRRDRIHGRELSIENMYATEGRLDVVTPSVQKLAKKYGVSVEEVERQVRRGIKIELEHTSSKTTAREIALDHLGERLDYYKKLATIGLEEDDSTCKAWLVAWWRDDQLPHREWFTNEETAQLYQQKRHSQGWETTIPQLVSVPPGAVVQDRLSTNEAINSQYSGQPGATETIHVLVQQVNNKWVDIAKYRGPDGYQKAEQAMHDLIDDYKDSGLEIPHLDISTRRNQPQTVYEVSGYIPSQRERNDPRFKSALTVDVNPYSIQDNARKLGSKIRRDGRPPLLRP